MKSDKAICKYDRKEIREQLAFFVQFTRDPKFICRKCARVSSKKELLCRPVKTAKLME